MIWPVLGLVLRPRRHLHQRERSRLAVDGYAARLRQIPAEEGDPHQLALEDVGRVVEERHQGEGFEKRLVLGCDQSPARRDLLEACDLDLGSGDDAQQPKGGPTPDLDELDENPARH